LECSTISYPWNDQGGINIKKLNLTLAILLVATITTLIKLPIDAFQPWNTAQIEYLSLNGNLSPSLNSVPGYFILGAILYYIGGLTFLEFTSLPLLAFHMAFINFVVIYFLLYTPTTRKSSKKPRYWSLLLLGFLSISILGEPFYFWRHAAGYILFFTLLVYWDKYGVALVRMKKGKIILLLVGIILPFVSYKLSFLYILVVVLAIAILYISRKTNITDRFASGLYSRDLLFMLMLIGVPLLRFNAFIYSTAIPVVIASAELKGASIWNSLKIWIGSLFSKSLDLCHDSFCLTLFKYPKYLVVARSFLIITLVLIIFVYITQNKNKIMDTIIRNVVIVSYILASVILAVFYAFLGTFHVQYVYISMLFWAIMGIREPCLAGNVSRLLRYLTKIFMVVALLVAILHAYLVFTPYVITPFSTPQTYSSSEFVSTTSDLQLDIVTDVYTRGYVMMYRIRLHYKICEDYLCNTNWLTSGDIFRLSNLDIEARDGLHIYLLNYEIPFVEAKNWIKIILTHDIWMRTYSNNKNDIIYATSKTTVIIQK